MSANPRRLLASACLAALCGVAPAHATAATELTVYRSDSTALFAAGGDSGVGEGYAVVREQRALQLNAGTQDLTLGDLPLYLDPEAMTLAFSDGTTRVRSQRLLLAEGNDATLAGLVGQHVDVLGASGQPLASGVLLRARNGLLVGDGHGATLVHDYAAVRAQGGNFPTGASLRLRVESTQAGTSTATLSYPTAGLGWHAAYLATLQPGAACRMRFESRASIANRSGRDWRNVRLQLVAGEPRIAPSSGPQPMMARAGFARSANAGLPRQSALADYRLYRLPGPLDLPDGSVSQMPLYAPRMLACERTALYDIGGGWSPPQPMLSPDFNTAGGGPITSTLRLTAFDSLPAGNLRVLGSDRRGTPQFIGEGRIEDTPKGADATITLGTAFDLRAQRQRTAFRLDKAARTMDEAFRITLSNAGDSPRVVTVREHPNRWREWTLVSSSMAPSKQAPDELEFRVAVPAAGKATLDYAVRYSWAIDQQTP